jgi:hypothetical protein
MSSELIGMRKEIAQYIICLNEAAERTHRSEDRQIYVKLLADSAILLALVETGAAQESIIKAAARHDRLWGHSWPVDDACSEAISAWQNCKCLIDHKS